MTVRRVEGPVLLTGGTGFVGSNVARRLTELSIETHVIIRPTSSAGLLAEARPHLAMHVHNGTTAGMIEIVTAVRPAVVLHLGSMFVAEHRSTDVAALVESNILFGAQLLEAMSVAGVRSLVNTGTSWQHFEDSDYCPVSLYAATKQAFEDIIAFFVAARGMRVISLHLFDTYGPGDPRPKLLHLLARAARTGEQLSMSPGEQLLDLVHIDDVVDAFLIATERVEATQLATHEVFAVSSGRTISLRELVTAVGNIVGQPLRVEWGGRPYREREVMRPWSTGRRLPDWTPSVELEVGLQRLLQGGGTSAH